MTCPGSACSPAITRAPSAGDRSWIRPRCRASSENTTQVAVNVLVEVTEISGPACRYTPPSHSRAMALPTALTTPITRPPLRFSSLTAARVSWVSPDWLTAM